MYRPKRFTVGVDHQARTPGMPTHHPDKADGQGFKMVNIRWLWIPLVGGSLLLAIPGHSSLRGIMGDIVGHLFSAALLATVPIVGYRLLYKQIGEKEITYIYAASWTYLVISQLLSS